MSFRLLLGVLLIISSTSEPIGPIGRLEPCGGAGSLESLSGCLELIVDVPASTKSETRSVTTVVWATDTAGITRKLESPYTVVLDAKPTTAEFGVSYAGLINNKPAEVVVPGKKCGSNMTPNIGSCNKVVEEPFGGFSWSEGRCCSPSGNLTSVEVHCLVMDPLWYQAFEVVGLRRISMNLTAAVLQRDDTSRGVIAPNLSLLRDSGDTDNNELSTAYLKTSTTATAASAKCDLSSTMTVQSWGIACVCARDMVCTGPKCAQRNLTHYWDADACPTCACKNASATTPVATMMPKEDTIKSSVASESTSMKSARKEGGCGGVTQVEMPPRYLCVGTVLPGVAGQPRAEVSLTNAELPALPLSLKKIAVIDEAQMFLLRPDRQSLSPIEAVRHPQLQGTAATTHIFTVGDLSGRTCNVVGASLLAFIGQSTEQCSDAKKTTGCFKNQPKDLWHKPERLAGQYGQDFSGVLSQSGITFISFKFTQTAPAARVTIRSGDLSRIGDNGWLDGVRADIENLEFDLPSLPSMPSLFDEVVPYISAAVGLLLCCCCQKRLRRCFSCVNRKDGNENMKSGTTTAAITINIVRDAPDILVKSSDATDDQRDVKPIQVDM